MFRTVFLRFLVGLLTLGAVACPAAALELPQGVEGICLTDLPEDALALEGRLLRSGDVLTAEQALLAEVISENDLEVAYLPVFRDHVAAEETLSLRGKENKAPVAEDQALETYKNLPNTGKLKVSDPEEEPMTFALVRQPRRGTVELGDDGSFTYTPKKNKVGVDSFTYTATDTAGKTSREATVTVTILKPSDAEQYRDTLGQDCRFAAEWMRHTGIFVGEQLAEEPCFGPEKTVSRGEFLTMLVKTLEIPGEETLSCTGCEDAPLWLQPYLTAAIRSGLTDGMALETFVEDVPITGAEAAILLENALDRDAFAHLTEQPLTRADAAQLLYEASRIHQSRKIDAVIIK